MIFHKKRLYRYKNIFILLAVSFMAMLFMLLLILTILDKKQHAQWVQEQCDFQNAYIMDWEYCGDSDDINDVIGKRLTESLPELSKGVMAIQVSVEGSDSAQGGQLQYLVGDYSQIAYPLEKGGVISLQNGENAFYVGEAYRPFLTERGGMQTLNLDGTDLPVCGILDDITGKGEDERLLLFGKDITDKLLEKIQASLENNQVQILYYSDDSDVKEDINSILEWISQNKNYQFTAVPYDQSIIYEVGSSVVMSFFKWAVYPVFVCCICNCLMIINVYVKRMKQNIYICRMCGMTYAQLAMMIGSDYGILLLPSVLVVGIFFGQFIKILLFGILMAAVFALLSLVFIRQEFRREGRCL